jgi:ribosomal-protein-alanine N-acetyltransferase
LADAPHLAAIDILVSPSPWRQDQFESTCGGAGNCALVWERGGEPAGFVVFSTTLDESTIYNIAVHPAQQGAGLGHGLLAAALDRMRQAGTRRCLLEVRASNRAARGLYEDFGFRLDGVRKDYYPAQGGREDALLMSRKI